MIQACDEQPLSTAQIDEVVERYPVRTGDILSILETLQEMHPLQYLPRETLQYVARCKGVALSNVFSVVTFYSFFNLQPQGRHTVMVCRGTACHTRGSKLLLDGILAEAGCRAQGDDASSSYTTPDHELTVRTVACFGQCALAPVVAVDDDIHSHVTDMKMRRWVRGLLTMGDGDNENT